MESDPRPEKTPLSRTMTRGSLSDSRRVQLFSMPQHRQAPRMNSDPAEVLEGPVNIFQSDRDTRGFERVGDINEREGGLTHLEGPWMNKINGKYYLTYAVPGTEYAGYCDGCAVADTNVFKGVLK